MTKHLLITFIFMLVSSADVEAAMTPEQFYDRYFSLNDTKLSNGKPCKRCKARRKALQNLYPGATCYPADRCMFVTLFDEDPYTAKNLVYECLSTRFLWEDGVQFQDLVCIGDNPFE